MFIPEITGKYEIIATFEGTKAYYQSGITTYLSVDPTSTPTMDTEEPTDTTESAMETPLITIETILMIAATIAIICGSAYWILKRK